MNQFLLIAIVASIIAFVATPLTLLVAQRVKFFAFPKANRWHVMPVPLLGGVAIWLALIVSLLVFGRGYAELTELAAIVAGATLTTGLGLLDDRLGLTPRAKTLGQILAALVVIAGGVRTSLFAWPLLDVALTVFWIVAITNAINLIDNMDGMAAGVSAAAAAMFMLLAGLNGQVLVASLAAALLGACLGFLVYNFQPALSFMGDTGALLLGFVLAILGIKLRFVALPTSLTWMVPILVLAVPIFDTALVMVSRIRRGVPVSRGGVDHTSHRLSRLGLGHRRVAIVLYALTVGFGLLALLVLQTPVWLANVIAAGLGVLGVVTIIVMEWLGALPYTPSLRPGMRVVVIGGGDGLISLARAAMKLAPHVTVVLMPLPKPVDGMRELAAPTLRELWMALSYERDAVCTIIDRDPTLFDEGSLDKRIALATGGLQLAATVVTGENDDRGWPVATPRLLAALREADLTIIGGDLGENALAALSLTDVQAALYQSRRPRVLVHDDLQRAYALLDNVGVAEVLTHAVSTADAAGEITGNTWLTVSALSDSNRVAQALSDIWVMRTRSAGSLAAVLGDARG